MGQTVRSITVQRGHDPRDFTLVAFGGAGPLHAAELADALGIGEVLVPPHPGITSAAGLLTSDLRYDGMRTLFMVEGAIDAAAVDAQLDALAAELVERLRRDGADPDGIVVSRALDCRYVGQGYELRIPVEPGGFAPTSSLRPSIAPTATSTATPSRIPIEIVNLRVTARGWRPKLERVAVSHGTLEEATLGQAPGVWRRDGDLVELPTRHLARERLPLDTPFEGPAVIFQRDTTVAVPPDWSVTATPRASCCCSTEEATDDHRAPPVRRRPSTRSPGR